MTHIDWLRLAFQAASRSHDPFTQNGAVLVPEAGPALDVVANTLPAGIEATPERLSRPTKYRFIEHAERNAIYAAARHGVRSDGATLYCVWFACTDCARAIIQAGIREVVGHAAPRQATPERWAEEVAAGEAMLQESGVAIRWIAGHIGCRIRFNGEHLEC